MSIAEQALNEFTSRLKRESIEAYESSPFSILSRDCFSRFWRDPAVQPGGGDIAIDKHWRIAIHPAASDLGSLMADHLRDFLDRCMEIELPVDRRGHDGLAPSIVLTESADALPAAFCIEVADGRITVEAADGPALRDGVVRLVDMIGLRRAPILSIGRTTYEPRLAVRLGTIAHRGLVREAVFLGYNALTIGWYDLYELSASEDIAELKRFRRPQSVADLAGRVAAAKRYGLSTYAHLELRKLPDDDPVFAAHPDLRGALVWKADGEHVLCTEHPLMVRYLSQTIESLFRAVPDLDGINIIVGGESFYHCFMRPYDQPKGHTNCSRCEAQGCDTVVANLVNRLAVAARRANPGAEVVVWPYSASGVWSVDWAQRPLIRKLQPGSGAVLMTEVEKEDHVTTPRPQSVRKPLWDYSIHLTGLGKRASQQIEACRRQGIAIYLKSEAETAMEAVRLPHIPCLDRWLKRAEAMANSGAAGAWVFPNFRPLYGSTAAEIHKHAWWTPAPDAETLLQELAARIAGSKAGPHLRSAWRYVSEAIAYSPELGPYYTGPTYLGPAHPMCCHPRAELPEVFHGRFLFRAEASFAEGLKMRPTYLTSPRGDDVQAFAACYEQMAASLARAAAEIDRSERFVPVPCRLTFAAEASSIRWFFRTAKTQTHFYQSCAFRDHFFKEPQVAGDVGDRGTAGARGDGDDLILKQWQQLLMDERENARAALPLAEVDMRLDAYFGQDHCFSHMTEMIRAKLDLLDHEIDCLLPSLRRSV